MTGEFWGSRTNMKLLFNGDYCAVPRRAKGRWKWFSSATSSCDFTSDSRQIVVNPGAGTASAGRKFNKAIMIVSLLLLLVNYCNGLTTTTTTGEFGESANRNELDQRYIDGKCQLLVNDMRWAQHHPCYLQRFENQIKLWSNSIEFNNKRIGNKFLLRCIFKTCKGDQNRPWILFYMCYEWTATKTGTFSAINSLT